MVQLRSHGTTRHDKNLSSSTFDSHRIVSHTYTDRSDSSIAEQTFIHVKLIHTCVDSPTAIYKSSTYRRYADSCIATPPFYSQQQLNRHTRNSRKRQESQAYASHLFFSSPFRKSLHGLPSSFKYAVVLCDHSEEFAPRPTKISAILRFRGT